LIFIEPDGVKNFLPLKEEKSRRSNLQKKKNREREKQENRKKEKRHKSVLLFSDWKK
jgi:hypothetical protein